MNVLDQFSLKQKVAVITGGAGLLGVKHAEAIIEAKGIPVLFDFDAKKLEEALSFLKNKTNSPCFGYEVDITQPQSIESAVQQMLRHTDKIDVLINNAANNPKMEGTDPKWSRAEHYPLATWEKDIAVGLTGAFLCTQQMGRLMAQKKSGVILNILSDLALIAPDQRIYEKPHLSKEEQPVKPPSYSAVKSGLLGLTRYFATYWAKDGVRVNSLSPGGIDNHQPEDFVQKLEALIPLGRMANADEYKAAIVFLVSDASSYMTGANLVIDGGRTTW